MNRSFNFKSTKLTTSFWNETKHFDYHSEGRGVPQRVMMLVAGQREKRIVKYVVSDLTTQMSKVGLI